MTEYIVTYMLLVNNDTQLKKVLPVFSKMVLDAEFQFPNNYNNVLCGDVIKLNLLEKFSFSRSHI